jgi:hypothetical protein
MTLYILKADNPKSPTDTGEPTRVRLIGPFKTNRARLDWAHDPANNPHDNPCWQCVDLDEPVIPVVAP